MENKARSISLPKHLALVRAGPGTEWLRIHSRLKAPLWFGPAQGSIALNRFDDPEGKFGVCYLGTSIDTCFAETFLRNPPVRIVSLADLDTRSVATLRLRRALNLVPLHGSNLAKLGVTAAVATGNEYQDSQELSRALWEHADAPDGILYRARHDDSAMCVCLFDRAKSGLEAISKTSLTKDQRLLARLLNTYGVALVN